MGPTDDGYIAVAVKSMPQDPLCCMGLNTSVPGAGAQLTSTPPSWLCMHGTPLRSCTGAQHTRRFAGCRGAHLGLACCNVLVLLSSVPAHWWPGTLTPFPWQRPAAASPEAAACSVFDTGVCKGSSRAALHATTGNESWLGIGGEPAADLLNSTVGDGFDPPQTTTLEPWYTSGQNAEWTTLNGAYNPTIAMTVRRPFRHPSPSPRLELCRGPQPPLWYLTSTAVNGQLVLVIVGPLHPLEVGLRLAREPCHCRPALVVRRGLSTCSGGCCAERSSTEGRSFLPPAPRAGGPGVQVAHGAGEHDEVGGPVPERLLGVHLGGGRARRHLPARPAAADRPRGHGGRQQVRPVPRPRVPHLCGWSCMAVARHAHAVSTRLQLFWGALRPVHSHLLPAATCSACSLTF